MKCELKLLSSLEKVQFEIPKGISEHTHGSMLKNEIYSFQLAICGLEPTANRFTCILKVQSELEPYIKVKRVEYVPVLVPSIEIDDDDDYISKIPGLFPDALQSLEDGKVEYFYKKANAYWITIEPNCKKTGIYPITLQLMDGKEQVFAEKTFTIEIIDALLPESRVCNTGWFHGDCLAKLHHVDIMSEAYWEIVEKYVAVYTKFGHNMILTPVFTPPLDTEVGKERLTNQLVDVFLDKGQYTFGFEKLKRWMNMCHRHGIRYFEMAHLFTQWGAKHAPMIMATVNGEYRRIFGWDTDALSDDYSRFLQAFLPELAAFLQEEQVMDFCYFHISDEPFAEHEEQYLAAKKMVSSYVPAFQWIDALSDYSFYEKGIVSKPVVASDQIHTFIEHGVENLWTYYCSGQRKGVANRFIAMPSYRNRILGYQLYKNRIEGFLHWGFNFWFTAGSTGVANPYIDTSSGGNFQSGDGFMVYPMGDDGEVVCSIRLYVFMEAMQDMRALELLESLTNRESVIALLEEIEEFDVYPRDSQYLLALRERVNQFLKREALKGLH